MNQPRLAPPLTSDLLLHLMFSNLMKAAVSDPKAKKALVQVTQLLEPYAPAASDSEAMEATALSILTPSQRRAVAETPGATAVGFIKARHARKGGAR